MSLRIGGNIPSLYNTTRINQSPDINRTSGVEQTSAAQSGQQDDRSSAGQYISREHGGVVQTKVSDANAYKKAQLDSNRARMEDMADKLYSKLPDIFNDMKKLNTGEEEKTAAARVAVTERNVAAVADRQQQDASQQLMDFAL